MAEISPLRRRMIEDMTVRNLSPATQQSYLNAVSKFSRYFGRIRLCEIFSCGRSGSGDLTCRLAERGHVSENLRDAIMSRRFTRHHRVLNAEHDKRNEKLKLASNTGNEYAIND
jgi:hypothetical protein